MSVLNKKTVTIFVYFGDLIVDIDKIVFIFVVICFNICFYKEFCQRPYHFLFWSQGRNPGEY